MPGSYSWRHPPRSETRGEEEARPRQGEEDADLGQAIVSKGQRLYTIVLWDVSLCVPASVRSLYTITDMQSILSIYMYCICMVSA